MIRDKAAILTALEHGGIVKYVWPLRRIDKENENEEEMLHRGDGPCGKYANFVIMMQIQEIGNENDFIILYFYDDWAKKLDIIQSKFKLRLYGAGVTVVQHEDGDSEELDYCAVIADLPLLRQCDIDVSEDNLQPVEVIYQEAILRGDSDQIAYSTDKCITINTPIENNVVKRGLRKDLTNYCYTPLKELGPGSANLYGVIVNILFPRLSRYNKKHMMTIHIIDKSHPHRNTALAVYIHMYKFDEFPSKLSFGDIIRFHKLKIEMKNGILVGKLDSRATRFLVVRGERDSSNELRLSGSSKSFTFKDSDQKLCNELLNWSKAWLKIDKTQSNGFNLPLESLKSIKPIEHVDILGKIVHIRFPSKEVPVGLLILWDGNYNDGLNGVEKFREFVSSNICGSLLEVQIKTSIPIEDLGYSEDYLNHQWCYLRGITIARSTEEMPGSSFIFSGIFSTISSILVLPEYAYEVQKCLNDGHQQMLQERPQNVNIEEQRIVIEDRNVEKENHPLRQNLNTEQNSLNHKNSYFYVELHIPDHINKNVPIQTFEEIYTSSTQAYKYHCYARVIGYYPQEIEEIVRSKKLSDGTMKLEYMLVLRMEDKSGTMDILVYGKHAENFFLGLPPCDLKKNNQSMEQVSKRLNTLRNSMKYMDICIESFVVQSRNISMSNSNESETQETEDSSCFSPINYSKQMEINMNETRRYRMIQTHMTSSYLHH